MANTQKKAATPMVLPPLNQPQSALGMIGCVCATVSSVSNTVTQSTEILSDYIEGAREHSLQFKRQARKKAWLNSQRNLMNTLISMGYDPSEVMQAGGPELFIEAMPGYPGDK